MKKIALVLLLFLAGLLLASCTRKPSHVHPAPHARNPASTPPKVAITALPGWSAADNSVALAQPGVPQSLGVNIHFYQDRPGEMKMLTAAGFHWIRMDAHWAAEEKQKGVYNFSDIAALVSMITRNHLGAIVILDYTNPLYDHGLSPYNQVGRDAFAAWAAALVKKFAGYHILWEMYNEPNGYDFWWSPPHIRKPNVHNYIKLALAVGQAIRRVNPRAKYVGPALSKMDFPFLKACFKAGLLRYWNAVTVHPYRSRPPETVAADYRRIRAMIHRYEPAGTHIPIISGEWGYASGPKFSTRRQARYLARQFLTNMANGIPISIWYDWHDDGPNPNNPENNFGITHFTYVGARNPVYRPKPAYWAVKAMSSALAGFRFNKRLRLASPQDHVLLFSKGHKVRLVAWTQATAHSVRIPASPGRFAVTSYLGKKLPGVRATTRGLKIKLTKAPQYLVPTGSNNLLTIAADWQTLPLEKFGHGPEHVVFQTRVADPTSQVIGVRLFSGAALVGKGRIKPGAYRVFSIVRPILRSSVRKPLRVLLAITGMGKIAQQTRISVVNPLRVEILPLGKQKFMARIDNPTGEEFSGTAEFSARKGQIIARGKTLLAILAGKHHITIDARSNRPLPINPQVHVTLVSTSGQLVAESSFQCQTNLAWSFGSPSVGTWPGTAQGDSWVAAKPPAPPPTQTGPVMRLSYHFRKKGAPVVSVVLWGGNRNPLRLIIGQPRYMTLWLYGDDSDNGMVARFKDTTGQVFQPQSGPIDWKGWKAVRFVLNRSSVWHYGGADNGTIHYPIQWNCVFLLDGSIRRHRMGIIYMASPTIVGTGQVTPK
jgi:hypothetical protein